MAQRTSPDGSRLALGRDQISDGVRIIDTRRMRTVKAFPLSSGAAISLNWVAPRKLLAAVSGLSIAFDPIAGRELWQRWLPSGFDEVARSPDGFEFLSPPNDYENPIGPSTLTTVDASGVVRSVVLDRVITGTEDPSEIKPTGKQRAAGLTVDAPGKRAFVVGSGEPIAEVDLGTLTVMYQGRTRTLAKLFDGPYRSATWLPNGTIAVTGYDGHVTPDAGESETPAGLTMVDPRDWSTRMIDPQATSIEVWGDTLIAYSWFARSGFAVYGLDGTLHLRALDGWSVQSLQAGGGTAFATTSNGSTGYQFAVVDLTSGRVLGMRPSSRANILLVP